MTTASSSWDFVPPDPSLEAAVNRFAQAFRDRGERTVYGSCGLLRYPSFEEWYPCQQRIQAGEEPGRIPSLTYFVRRRSDGAVIGVTDIRRYLNREHYHDGHIGLSIHPRERGKGLGKAVLAQALRRAGELGIRPVVVTCNLENQASRRMIEACGLSFRERFVEPSGQVVLIFSLELS